MKKRKKIQKKNIKIRLKKKKKELENQLRENMIPFLKQKNQKMKKLLMN